MPIGVNVDNPQEQVSTPTASTLNSVDFAGNSIGGAGGNTSSGTDSLSTILLYGAIALVIIFILKKLSN
jgi:hypothetical protein